MTKKKKENRVQFLNFTSNLLGKEEKIEKEEERRNDDKNDL